ncbi:MAG TPA: DUF1569 domain-containing protein [Puia sp.]|nr:DUF1569 domain-containing protein [Puia sp.]
MKSVFDKFTRDELITRISSLNENNKAQWGKMNVAQMVKHCRKFEELTLGKVIYKQSFLGKLFGKMALKNILKTERMKPNLPTVPSFRVMENDIDMAAEKNKWISLINEYEHYPDEGFVHPFFGRMTKEKVGPWSYRHADHHLRQFNA